MCYTNGGVFLLYNTVETNIYIISDSLGETGELVIRAAISQFDNLNFELTKIPCVNDLLSLEQVLQDIKKVENSIIFYTLVENDLLCLMKEYVFKHDLVAVDLLSPVINAIKSSTDLEPIREPGVIRRIDEDYFKRIDSIEFAVKYDDGKDPSGLADADVVILGISRTSKTPLSMYLAGKKIKAANIPLVPETKLPEELFDIPARKIIGLTNSPFKINEIREERSKALGLPRASSYSSLERILEEIEYADRIMKRIGCIVIDVSNKAIEETAEIIIDYLKKMNSRIAIN